MVGLHLIKHMDGLADEVVCARYLDSPYVGACYRLRCVGRALGSPRYRRYAAIQSEPAPLGRTPLIG